MPCALCGEWAEQCTWEVLRRPTAQNLKDLKHWQQDADDPDTYWYRKCYPSCQLADIYRRIETLEERVTQTLRDLKIAVKEFAEESELKEDKALEQLARNRAEKSWGGRS